MWSSLERSEVFETSGNSSAMVHETAIQSTAQKPQNLSWKRYHLFLSPFFLNSLSQSLT